MYTFFNALNLDVCLLHKFFESYVVVVVVVVMKKPTRR